MVPMRLSVGSYTRVPSTLWLSMSECEDVVESGVAADGVMINPPKAGPLIQSRHEPDSSMPMPSEVVTKLAVTGPCLRPSSSFINPDSWSRWMLFKAAWTEDRRDRGHGLR